MKLLSDQVDEQELAVILRELQRTIENGILGDIVEFGCYVGTTSIPMAQMLKTESKMLYVYDSFEGLPEKTAEDQSPVGLQFKPGELHATKRQLIINFKRAGLPLPIITKCWFSVVSNTQIPEQISFAFLDGDYYRSVLDPLKLIWNNLSPNATVIVDDYSNEALPVAAKAVDEWITSHPSHLRVEHSLAIIKPIPL